MFYAKPSPLFLPYGPRLASLNEQINFSLMKRPCPRKHKGGHKTRSSYFFWFINFWKIRKKNPETNEKEIKVVLWAAIR